MRLQSFRPGARRRVRMRSALLLTTGVCFAMALYRVLNSLNSTGFIWPTRVLGVLLEALVSLLVFGGLLLFLVLISLKALKRYPFTFLGEKE